MSTWGQSEKSIAAWIHHLRKKRIQSPGLPPLLTIHHPPTLEYSTWLTNKSCYYNNCTQLDSLTSKILHNIGMWYGAIAHRNKLKLVLVQLLQSHPILGSSMAYIIIYTPLDYYMYCNNIFYAWKDRCLGH